MKKILLAGLLMMALASTTFASSFSDVSSKTYYNASIEWMAENGVIKGYGDGTFGPDNCVNRAEFLKMVFKTLEVDVSVFGISDKLFSDTPSDQWYTQYVIAGLASGMINGYPDGTFKPGQCVNRVEAIKMAVLKFNNGKNPGAWGMYGNPFDVAQVKEAWWKEYFATAMGGNFVGTEHFVQYDADWSKLGIDSNFVNPTYNFEPGESMTRKEVAEMLYRFKAAWEQGGTHYESFMKPKTLKPSDDCVELGFGWHGARGEGNSPLAFCYRGYWGETQWEETSISPEARIGTVYYVTFTDAVESFPLISYETLDFEKTGDSDVPAIINWDKVDFNKSNSELAKLMVGDENVVAQKLEINGTMVLKITSDRPQWDSEELRPLVQYFVPKVSISGVEYNLHLIGSDQQEADLDKMMGSMSF